MFLLETLSLFTQSQCEQKNATLPELHNQSGYEVISCLGESEISSLCSFLTLQFPYKSIRISMDDSEAMITLDSDTASATHRLSAQFDQPVSAMRGRKLLVAMENSEETTFLKQQLTSISQECNIELVDIESGHFDIVLSTTEVDKNDTSSWQIYLYPIDGLPAELPAHWLAMPCFDSDIMCLINKFRLTTTPRVIVADDSPSSLLATQLLLESLNCHVTTATDGESALALLRSHEYDLVMLDERMPGLKGSEVIQVMREEDGLTQSLTVAMSGITDETEVSFLKASGFEKYLSKPVKRQNLMQLLSEWRCELS